MALLLSFLHVEQLNIIWRQVSKKEIHTRPHCQAVSVRTGLTCPNQLHLGYAVSVPVP